LTLLPGLIPELAVAETLYLSGGGGGGGGGGPGTGGKGGNSGIGGGGGGGGGGFGSSAYGGHGGGGGGLFSGGGGGSVGDVSNGGNGGDSVGGGGGGGGNGTAGGNSGIGTGGDGGSSYGGGGGGYSGSETGGTGGHYSGSTGSGGGGGGMGYVGNGTNVLQVGGGSNGGNGNPAGVGGGGGSVTYSLTNSLTIDQVVAVGGDGGDKGNRDPSFNFGGAGGAGGNVELRVEGLDRILTATSVTITSGANGQNNIAGKGKGGNAKLIVEDKLIAPTIELTKKGGDLVVNVGKLDVTEDTALKLDDTDAGSSEGDNKGVFFTEIDIANDRDLTVTRVKSGNYAFETLNVLEKDAGYRDDLRLDTNADQILTFALNGITSSDVMLTVSKVSTETDQESFINGSTIKITGFSVANAKSESRILIQASDADIITGKVGAFHIDDAPQATPGPDVADVHRNVYVFRSDDKQKLEVKEGLIWNQFGNAHGTFNVVNGSSDRTYTVDEGLADNVEGAVGTSWNSTSWEWNNIDWDGKSLTKTGTGKLILSGGNEYTGDTTVSEGILELAATGSLESDVTVKVDATFALHGTVGGSKNVLLESGSSLNAYKGGKVMGNLSTPDNGDSTTLRFYLPHNISAGDVLLTVNGAATIIDSAIELYVYGEKDTLDKLEADDEVTLIDTDETSSDYSTVDGMKVAGFRLARGGDDDKDLVARRCQTDEDCGEIGFDPDDPNPGPETGTETGTGTGTGTETETETETETGTETGTETETDPALKLSIGGYLAGTALLNQGADFLVGQGLPAALGIGPEGARLGLHAFAALGGGKLRHKTGSHIDVNGVILITGLSATRTIQAGDLTLGAFFEHGEGDYSTHTSLGNGQGDANYSGGGLLAHLEFNETPRGHLYAEATARAGLIDLDFTADADRSRSDYASAHVGLGYVVKLDEYSALNLYGRYLWSRQGSDTVRRPSGGDMKFEAVESRRTRLGLRWSSRNASRTGELYFGAAWEREHDGKSKAIFSDDQLTTPKLKGNTTLVEAGFIFNPVKPLTLEFGVQGHTGRREGVTGCVKVEYRF
jgi:hypothetical protein